MAEHDKKDSKPKDSEKDKDNRPFDFHSIPAMFAQSIMDIVVKDGARWAYTKATEAGEAKIEDRASRARNKHYFADAMVKLRARDPHAADVIEDFFIYYLDNDTDREDFQHNSAKVGSDKSENLTDTVQFLWDLAQLPTHRDREVLITALGFIGARSVDIYERAQGFLNTVAETPGKVGEWAKEKLGPEWRESSAAIADMLTNDTDRLNEELEQRRARLEEKKNRPTLFGKLRAKINRKRTV